MDTPKKHRQVRYAGTGESEMRIVIIGLGGIGTHIVEPICRTLALEDPENGSNEKSIVLVDGDKYETKNRVRQKFLSQANKAEATKEWLEPLFPELSIETKPRFVDAKSIFLFVKDGDVVFLAVDNHATRKVVSNWAEKLKDVLIISGGNEEYDGNVQIYERKGGKDLNASLTKFHPEIENPKDKNPAELSCQELAKLPSSRQILAVNLTIAAMMLNAFMLRKVVKHSTELYDEIYFDFFSGKTRGVKRPA